MLTLALSGVWDHYHRYEDVATGMGLGAFVAFTIHHAHFGSSGRRVGEHNTLTEMEKERMKTHQRHNYV